MQIQINTDHNIEGREALADHVRDVVTSTLAHVRSHITRVEVHLGDDNGHSTHTGDKRCMMEARLESRPPMAVTCHAPSVHQALDGAAQKLLRVVESNIGRLHDQGSHGTDSLRHQPVQTEIL